MDPSIQRYFREALESADAAASPREGLWQAFVSRLGLLEPREVPESIRERFAMWKEAVTFAEDDPGGVGTARLTAEGMSDDDAQKLIAVVREMAVEIGAVQR